MDVGRDRQSKMFHDVRAVTANCRPIARLGAPQTLIDSENQQKIVIA